MKEEGPGGSRSRLRVDVKAGGGQEAAAAVAAAAPQIKCSGVGEEVR